MPSLEHFRMMPDEDLLLHGKEATTYTDEYTIALVERFEDLLGLAERMDFDVGNLLSEVGSLEAEVEDLNDEIDGLNSQLCAALSDVETREGEIDRLQAEVEELRFEIRHTHS